MQNSHLSSSVTSYSIGVLSDTHGYLPPQIFELFAGVDLILHSGDVGRDDILFALAAVAPIRAVSGNVDGIPTHERPLKIELATPAGRIAMTHGHLAQAPSYDLEKLRAHFAGFAPDILVYGHSHIPFLQQQNGIWMLNPGSAGQPRFGRKPSVARISIPNSGAAVEITLIPL